MLKDFVTSENENWANFVHHLKNLIQFADQGSPQLPMEIYLS